MFSFSPASSLSLCLCKTQRIKGPRVKYIYLPPFPSHLFPTCEASTMNIVLGSNQCASCKPSVFVFSHSSELIVPNIRPWDSALTADMWSRGNEGRLICVPATAVVEKGTVCSSFTFQLILKQGMFSWPVWYHILDTGNGFYYWFYFLKWLPTIVLKFLLEHLSVGSFEMQLRNNTC